MDANDDKKKSLQLIVKSTKRKKSVDSDEKSLPASKTESDSDTNDHTYSSSQSGLQEGTEKPIHHKPERHCVVYSNKKFKCEMCCYRSSKKCYLKVHMKSHTVQSSYKCGFCEYAAISRNMLTRHFNEYHLHLD